MPTPSPDPLLTVRSALILLLALVVGGAAGTLAFLAHNSLPAAALVGGSATGGAILLFNTMVGR